MSYPETMKRSRAGRARRDDRPAKRGTYGGMCLCPCKEGELAPMATFDPEDPYYSGDRTRKRRSSRDVPKLTPHQQSLAHRMGLDGAGTDGLGSIKAASNQRTIVRAYENGSLDLHDGNALSFILGDGEGVSHVRRRVGDRARKRRSSRDGHKKKLRYTLRSGKTLLGTITAVPDARGQFWWQSNVSKDRGITTGLDKAIHLVLKDAGANPARHNVTLYDWTGRSRVIHA